MAGAASQARGAIVTGGSRGLGLEMAFALARSGVSVLAAAHIEDGFVACRARGWGRIINVTTMLSTMERSGFAPYGSSKAALEMASSVWAADLKETGVTVNILNPAGGANTLGIAAEAAQAAGRPAGFLLKDQAALDQAALPVEPSATSTVASSAAALNPVPGAT